jgi:hypothetical protein
VLNYTTTVHLAESVLSSAFSSPVHIRVDEKLDSRHLVLRCKLFAASGNAPTSIILKQMAVDAPPERSPHPLDFFLNELSSLRFSSKLLDQINLGPRLYCCHRGAGLLVIEDLGDHQTLREILQGTDSRFATDALSRFAQYLGKVHVATNGKEGVFKTLQFDVGAASLPIIADLDIRNTIGDLNACLGALQIKPPVGFSRAIDHLEAAIHNGRSTQST